MNVALGLISLSMVFQPLGASVAGISRTIDTVAQNAVIEETQAAEQYQTGHMTAVQVSRPHIPKVRNARVLVTAYSSTPEETDSTPFTTASNTLTRDGVVAANFLKFGTTVRFPDMYGAKAFVVEDRMAQRFSDRMDIWFSSKEEAKQFGVRYLAVEIE
jgi:3D (Asp-Asp-Asp) domain-containing protein